MLMILAKCCSFTQTCFDTDFKIGFCSSFRDAVTICFVFLYVSGAYFTLSLRNLCDLCVCKLSMLPILVHYLLYFYAFWSLILHPQSM